MALFRNAQATFKIKKSLMDFNTFFFGAIIVVSLAIFFYIGKFKASSKQREREKGKDTGSL